MNLPEKHQMKYSQTQLLIDSDVAYNTIDSLLD